MMEPSRNVQNDEGLLEMSLRPVGVVRSTVKEPSLGVGSGDAERRARADRRRQSRSATSELVIDSDLDGILDGTEDFSHLLVLYWAHRIPPESRSLLKGHPMGRKDLPLLGIFALRSPARPNPICLAMVQLLERKANVLKVAGLDAVDGSPLLDIKPYIPEYDSCGEVKVPDWVVRLRREFAEGSPSAGASEGTQ